MPYSDLAQKLITTQFKYIALSDDQINNLVDTRPGYIHFPQKTEAAIGQDVLTSNSSSDLSFMNYINRNYDGYVVEDLQKCLKYVNVYLKQTFSFMLFG